MAERIIPAMGCQSAGVTSECRAINLGRVGSQGEATKTLTVSEEIQGSGESGCTP